MASFKLGTIIEYTLITAALLVLVLSPLLQSYLTSSHRTEDAVTSVGKHQSLVVPDESLVCAPHGYTTHILSSYPLVIYIDRFLSNAEADELIDLSAEHFVPSTVFHAGVESHDPTIRNSSKALLPRTPTVQCIEARARDFQGWRKDVSIERLWAQLYRPGGHYVHHFDWGAQSKAHGGRVSTYMVYVSADCTGGGTNFPRLPMPSDDKWCKFLDCESNHAGVTFSPRKGSAVFWENYKDDGSGFEETWHAGLPVESGTKIGLNIWSWYQPGSGVHTAD